MKMKKSNRKPILLALSAFLLSLGLTACSREDARTVIPKAQESIENIDSISYDMVMNMELSGNEAGQSMAMTTIASADYILEPEQMRLTMNMNIGGLDSMDTTMYVLEENGKYKIYTGMGKGTEMYWFASETESMDSVGKFNAAANLDLYLASAQSFTENGEETINGTETIRYDGVVSKDALQEVVTASGVFSQMEQLGLPQESMDTMYAMLTGLDDLPISIWIAKDTYIPMKYEMNMTALMQAMISRILTDMGEDSSAIHIDNVSVSMTISDINNVKEIVVPDEALNAQPLPGPESMEGGLNMPSTETVITEDNYQTLFHVAQEAGYQYVGCAYHKAPEGMYGVKGYVDAYLPYGEDLVYEDDGYTVRAAAHGMEVRQTIMESEKNARDIVDEAYDALVSSGLDIYEGGVEETQYNEEYDIACKQVTYFTEDGTIPRITLLYADYKQDGYYLCAEITYLPEQMDEEYPALLEELSDVFAMNLPMFNPY